MRVCLLVATLILMCSAAQAQRPKCFILYYSDGTTRERVHLWEHEIPRQGNESDLVTFGRMLRPLRFTWNLGMVGSPCLTNYRSLKLRAPFMSDEVMAANDVKVEAERRRLAEVLEQLRGYRYAYYRMTYLNDNDWVCSWGHWCGSITKNQAFRLNLPAGSQFCGYVYEHGEVTGDASISVSDVGPTGATVRTITYTTISSGGSTASGSIYYRTVEYLRPNVAINCDSGGFTMQRFSRRNGDPTPPSTYNPGNNYDPQCFCSSTGVRYCRGQPYGSC